MKVTEFNKIRLADFYFKYLLVITFLTSIFYWFQGDLISWGRLLLVLILPLPIVWRNKRKQEEKLPVSHFEILGIVGALILPGTFSQGMHVNAVLCGCFYVAAVFLCFLNKYLRGRYLVLHRNPSASEETKMRAGRFQRRPLMKLVIMGSVVLLLLLVVSIFAPEMQWQSSERTNREQQEQDNRVEEASNKKEEAVKEKLLEEQEKAANNPWLQLLRYVIIFVVVVLGIFAIAYVLFRFVLYLMRRRRPITYEYQEQVEEKSDFEEITRLIPVVKHSAEFLPGRDGQIRKAFYLSVQRGAGKQKVDRTLTPMELRRKYLRESSRNELLTSLYEKARYAKTSVSEEEWKKWEEVRKS